MNSTLNGFENVHYSPKKKRKSIVRIIILLLACLGDQISDSLYIIQNWNSFGSQSLKIASMFFFCFPLFLNYCMSFYLLKISKKVQRMGQCEIVCLICCCFWIPLSLLLTLILWTKILDLLDYCEITTSMFDDNDNVVKSVIKYSSMFELFFEDIPQIIIQSVNNKQTSNWGTIQIVSLGFSGVMIVVSMCVFLFCPEQD